MIPREPVEHIDEGHTVPPHGPPPDLGAETGLLIRPGHLPGLVPAVPEQTCPAVAHVCVHDLELTGDVIPVLRYTEGGGIHRAKRLGHIGPVEPDLVGVDGLVPVCSAGGTRLCHKLFMQELRGLGVLRILRHPVDDEQRAAHFYVVESMSFRLVAFDRCSAVGFAGDVLVDRGPHVGEVGSVGRLVPFGDHSVQQHAFFVAPLPRRLYGRHHSSRPLADHCRCHTLCQGQLAPTLLGPRGNRCTQGHSHGKHSKQSHPNTPPGENKTSPAYRRVLRSGSGMGPGRQTESGIVSCTPARSTHQRAYRLRL